MENSAWKTVHGKQFMENSAWKTVHGKQTEQEKPTPGTSPTTKLNVIKAT
jgi:hypothetical protein